MFEKMNELRQRTPKKVVQATLPTSFRTRARLGYGAGHDEVHHVLCTRSLWPADTNGLGCTDKEGGSAGPDDTGEPHAQPSVTHGMNTGSPTAQMMFRAQVP